MKNLGWNLFFALALADVVAVVMLRLGVMMKIVFAVAGLVFAILAVVMSIAGHARSRAKKQEEKAKAELATLRSQVETTPTATQAKEKRNEPPVQNT